MFKNEKLDYLEEASLYSVQYTATGIPKKPKWLDRTDEVGKVFELKTRELFLNLGADYINIKNLHLDFSETKSPQKKYDVDCFAIVKKKGLANNKAGFILICECKTTKSERMKAVNHGFFNKIKSNKTFIKQRLNKIFKEKYIPIFILATEGFKYSPELKKKYLDEQVILMSEQEAKYLTDCYSVSKSQDFAFNQFLSLYRSRSLFYDNLCVGAFETFTDFTRKKNAYTFSAKAGQMIKLTGVAHRVAEGLISDQEGKILNTDYYQRILTKGRLAKLGQYLDREKKPFNNNILLSYRGSNKDFNFKFLSNVGEGRTGELTVKGKPGSFHVIDGQHRLFGYMAVTDERVLDQTLIVTVFKNLSQSEEAQIFLDVNSNQKKVDIALRREVQLILGESATGKEQVDNLATLLVIGLREEKKSPFNDRPKAIPLPESGGILKVEQLRKAILNGGLIARKNEFKRGSLNIDDDFNKTYAFSLNLLITYFSKIREAVEKNGNYWRKPTPADKSVALRTNFICGCILLLERMIDKAFEGKDINPYKIEEYIEKYLNEFLYKIERMSDAQRNLLFGWRKKGVDMEEGSGKFPSARAHLIDELLPNYQDLLYDSERDDYINAQSQSSLDEFKRIMNTFSPENLGMKALHYEQRFYRSLHRFLSALFGDDYWQDVLEIYLNNVSNKIIAKKSLDAKSKWRGLAPDGKDVMYSNTIDWAEWSNLEEIFSGLFKDSNGAFQSRLKCKQPIRLKNLITETFFIRLRASDAKPQGTKGLEWMEFLASLRNNPSHPRDDSSFTMIQKETYTFVEDSLFEIISKMDEFIRIEEED